MSTHIGKLGEFGEKHIHVSRNGGDNGVLIYDELQDDIWFRALVPDDIAAAVALDLLEQARLGENEHFGRAIAELTAGLAEVGRAQEEDERIREWRGQVYPGVYDDGDPVTHHQRAHYRRELAYFTETKQEA